ncbi:MAG TPA: cell division protein FtsL [bacterium]|nr:cell division protein FtsL [bacterium]
MSQVTARTDYEQRSARVRRGQARRRRQATRSLDEWIGWSGVALFFLVLAVVVAYALLLTHTRGEVVQLGYDIRLQSDSILVLQREVNQLQLERLKLRSPERLQQMAGELGLTKPLPEQVKVINDQPADR